MFEKKLVTLACAVGILACGACFLPPLPQHAPPPPPVQLDLHGIQRIRVQVIDNSEPHRLAASDVANWVALRVTSQAKRANVTAFSQKEPANEDAVLQVTLLSETAAPQPNETGAAWDFHVNVSAVLTKAGGQVVWQESDGVYEFHRASRPESVEELWKDPAIQNWLTLAVGDRLAYRMLSGR
jgi:hypothetical protein